MTLQFHFHLLHSKFRIMSYDFDLNEAMDILWFCHKNDLGCCRFRSFEYPNSPKFQLVKTQKLSDLC